MAIQRAGKPPFVHEKGICETEHLGPDTKVWAFAHVLGGARLGANCNVCAHVFIENDVIVGDDVTIKSGVQLWDGLRVGDRVFIGPNATFTNDRRPRSKQFPEAFLQTVLEDDVSIGANATILPGIRIGRGAMVGAGAVVTRDVPPFATVVGNPAVVVNYVETEGSRTGSARTQGIAGDALGLEAGSRVDLGLRDCFLERLPHFADMRGSLVPLEAGRGLPFPPARIFLVHAVANSRIRGEHAHRVCRQFLIATHGELSVVLDDGEKRVEVRLDSPNIGLHLAPMVWGIQYKFSADAVLTVVASHGYDPDDYIRDYEDFIALVGRG
ncbi:WxcM-like domain-containing protein [Enterovirga rhinocerotis]|uniref:Transferase family hexapeptide repeat protein n=1 Tax=Enterovirga rhinocerotis TaxID=1339210 RepID=A0A4R7CAC7_9HYPH|nr:WxcM-like domain-containing protein [Enterovirga rhinocerotis]TDR95012.1 transferase family hexapeptide repeat protein [Enterovirga rhinocerotis]